MDFKKLAPWNWFKKEEEESGSTVPVRHHAPHPPADRLPGPFVQLQREMDRLFADFFTGFGSAPFRYEGFFPGPLTSGLLKPTLDIGANDREYTISVEVPGVDQKDVKIEITNNTLTIRGEKRQETEEKEKNFYRMERSYGSFQRTLSLPEDADQEKINAVFKNGVLTVTMPRKALPQAEVKRIEIR
ncbi:MAG: Hsp20/alpha crystallin family protein [Desulfobulbaceae bacterium]|nr:Hsp20/alpha crystallin family protein [Desulfobulbaceae bacterium]